MDIRIYQINPDRDDAHVKFLGLDHLKRIHNTTEVCSSIYDKVYEGSTTAKNLEGIYREFNLNHPLDYQAHSLSVSDVVEIVHGSSFVRPGFYFCDNVGFQSISFAPENTHTRATVQAILLEPGKEARKVDLLTTPESLQYIVGGTLELLTPYADNICIVCNADRKMLGMPDNRSIRTAAISRDMSYQDLTKSFRSVEAHPEHPHIVGYVVFTPDSFSDDYSEQSRTYLISSNNKAFQSNMGGYSIYGYCLDGTDQGVRLERYMYNEHGGKDGWKIERCYMEEPGHVMDYLQGNAIIFGINGNQLTDLSNDQLKYYLNVFRYPEHIAYKNAQLLAEPYDPKRARTALDAIVATADKKKSKAAHSSVNTERDTQR